MPKYTSLKVLLFYPILIQYSISIPAENVRKPLVFLTFSGDIEMEQRAKIVQTVTLWFYRK